MSQNVELGAGAGGSEPEQGKKRSIDDIIEHMTADLQSYEGQYILLGSPGPGSGTGGSVWAPSPAGPPAPGPPQPPQAVFYQPLRERKEMMMMDVGGGKFVEVVFRGSPPPHPPQHQTSCYIHYQQPPVSVPVQSIPALQPHIIDYSQRGYNESLGNGCLIENVVGNWVPNRSGTYSPFPGVSQEEPCLPAQAPLTSAPPHSPLPQGPVKKQRMVAEVKPMRPSYSDVLAKSPPLTPPPTAKTASKPVLIPPGGHTQTQTSSKSEGKKNQHKSPIPSNGKSVGGGGGGGGGTGLRRENSTGSNEEALAEKARAALRRWLSQDLDQSSQQCQPPVCRSQPDPRKEKKRKSKQSRSGGDVFDKSDEGDRKETEGERDSGGKSSGGREGDGSETEEPPSPPHCPPSHQRKEGKAQSSGERPVKSVKQPRDSHDRKGSGNKGERSSTNPRNSKNKRIQRSNRKKEGALGLVWRAWQEKCSVYAVFLTRWLVNLLWDVTAMSAALLLHLFGETVSAGKRWVESGRRRGTCLLGSWGWRKKGRKKSDPHPTPHTPPLPGSLQHNITLPVTGEEAMKRLLSCKGKDPYSILGVTSNCSDEEIKKYYKSQALLVHPDKNSQPGAEEAFKILVHAFDLIAEPEKRAAYDRYVAETNQVEQVWSELSDLISQLHEKMEYAANTIRCNNCGKRHKRELTGRPIYAARYCAQCKIHHSVKEGDMWAESRGWGWWSSRYYACMEGSVYDITQWAHCQGPTVHRLKADAHTVQYRVLVGRPPPPPTSSTASPSSSHTSASRSAPSEAEFEELLNSLYPGGGGGVPGAARSAKRRSKKAK